MPITDSRDRILHAGLELFFAGTFHSVGVTEICKSANVNKGTLYHYFTSKTDVLLGVLERYTDLVAEDYQAIANSPAQPDERLRAFFKVAQRNSLRFRGQSGFCPGCFIGNMTTEVAASDARVRERAQWAMDRLIAIFEPTIAELFDREGVACDSRAGANVFMGLLQGAQVMAKLRNDAAVFDAFAATALSTVLSAGAAVSLGREVQPAGVPLGAAIR